jgi:hypothetical protein
MHLLRQIMMFSRLNPNRKYGGLIIDPKSALINDVREVMHDAGRGDDLIIINTEEMNKRGRQPINLIDCMLKPMDLAKALVLSARSAGIGGSDPYWFQAWQKAFASTLYLLQLRDKDRRIPTLRVLMDTLLGTVRERINDEVVRKPKINYFLQESENLYDQLSHDERNDCDKALNRLYKHLENKDTRSTVDQFMDDGYGIFEESNYRCFSGAQEVQQKSIYDQIINEGKVVLVSISQQELALSRFVPALIKLLFQQTVLSRFSRWKKGELDNGERPLLFMADEYSSAATEIPGDPMGDSDFFSKARQFGCLCFIATQSVEMLESSSIKESWKAILGNMAAMIFMRLKDPASAKYAEEYAGKKDVLITSTGQSQSKDGSGTSKNVGLQQKEDLASRIVRHTLGEGDTVVIGTTAGHKASSTLKYAHVE